MGEYVMLPVTSDISWSLCRVSRGISLEWVVGTFALKKSSFKTYASIQNFRIWKK